MRRHIFNKFTLGLVCGSLLSMVMGIIVMNHFVSIETGKVIVVKRFPGFVQFVQFENELVEITVNNFQYYKESDLGCKIKIKKDFSEEIYGVSRENEFILFYADEYLIQKGTEKAGTGHTQP